MSSVFLFLKIMFFFLIEIIIMPDIKKTDKVHCALLTGLGGSQFLDSVVV